MDVKQIELFYLKKFTKTLLSVSPGVFWQPRQSGFGMSFFPLKSRGAATQESFCLRCPAGQAPWNRAGACYGGFSHSRLGSPVLHLSSPSPLQLRTLSHARAAQGCLLCPRLNFEVAVLVTQSVWWAETQPAVSCSTLGGCRKEAPSLSLTATLHKPEDSQPDLPPNPLALHRRNHLESFRSWRHATVPLCCPVILSSCLPLGCVGWTLDLGETQLPLREGNYCLPCSRCWFLLFLSKNSLIQHVFKTQIELVP